jgi:hypothetical protein
MLKVLKDESIVKKYRQQFIKSFKPFWDEKIQVSLGHPGGVIKATVLWSDRLGLWLYQEKKSENRYGHAFGVGKPVSASSIPITCEINFPLHGIDRRMGGALAEDRHGQVFVVHRGKIGGGKKGVGKSLFDQHYRGAWALMEDGDSETTVALVGMLGSPRFVRQTVQFIRKVDAMKEVLSRRSSQMEMTFGESHFREEWVGRSYDEFEGQNELNCDHGLIVSDLYAALKIKGVKAANDAVRDLFAVNAKGQATAVFQVTTGHSRTALNDGMSALLLSNVDLPLKPRLFLVVPAGIDPALTEKLKKTGIDTLEYEWREDRAVFLQLQDVINIR